MGFGSLVGLMLRLLGLLLGGTSTRPLQSHARCVCRNRVITIHHRHRCRPPAESGAPAMLQLLQSRTGQPCSVIISMRAQNFCFGLTNGKAPYPGTHRLPAVLRCHAHFCEHEPPRQHSPSRRTMASAALHANTAQQTHSRPGVVKSGWLQAGGRGDRRTCRVVRIGGMLRVASDRQRAPPRLTLIRTHLPAHRHTWQARTGVGGAVRRLQISLDGLPFCSWTCTAQDG